MSAIPETARERVQQALHVTGWMLKAIEAPRDYQYWPRRDREAWMDVVGRPRLREVIHGLMIGQHGAPDVEVTGPLTIDPINTLRAEAGLDSHAIVEVDDAPPAWHHVEARDAYKTTIEIMP